MDTLTLNGLIILQAASGGPALESERDATDLIGEALGADAEIVVVPVERLSADFFRLETRKAGLFIQKFTNYRIKLVLLGDISAHLSTSRALTDFVRESNRGDSVWFLPDRTALEAKLAGG